MRRIKANVKHSEGSEPDRRQVAVELDGARVTAHEGEPLACSLIAADEVLFSRSVKYHRPRGAFCLQGACGACLMRVDGVPNVYTCRTAAASGQRLERQNAYPSGNLDVFSLTDWLFPRGLNHHEMFAGVPVAQEVMAKVARQLAGLGTLPDRPAPARPQAQVLKVDTAVVGAGPSGLAAAAELTRLHKTPVVFERDGFVGGRAIFGVPERPVELPTAEVKLHHTVVGLFDDEGGRFLAVVDSSPTAPSGQQLLKVYVQRLVLALGGHPILPAFENNDLPGIYASRAVARLIRRHRVMPGERIAVVGDPGEAEALAALITEHGSQAVAVGAEPVAAHGMSRVTGLTVRRGGAEERVECDAVALCTKVAPSYELARQGGARVVFDGARFIIEADADGRTLQEGIVVAGEQTGAMPIAKSVESGRRAARALLGVKP